MSCRPFGCGRIDVLRIWLLISALVFPLGSLVAQPTVSEFTLSSDSLVAGFGASVTGVVTLGAPAPDGGASVPLVVEQGFGDVTIPASLTVAAGETVGTFEIREKEGRRAGYASVRIAAGTGAGSKKASLTIRPLAFRMSVDPLTCSGGEVTGTIVTGALVGSNSGWSSESPYPVPSDVAVTLSSPSNLITIPASVTIPAGTDTAVFTIQVKGARIGGQSASITGEARGWSASAYIQIPAVKLTSLTFSQGSVVGGQTVTATATLDGAAPEGGYKISPSISSNHPNGRIAGGVPDEVVIPAGSRSATFTVYTSRLDRDVTATLRAGYFDGNSTLSMTAPLTVTKPGDTLSIVPASVALDPTQVIAGQSSQGTVTLSGPAPAGGVNVIIHTSSGQFVDEGGIHIQAGKRTGTFTIRTTGSGSASVLALIGESDRSTQLTANPVDLESLAVRSASLPGGARVNGSVKLNAPAPSGGMRVNLASSNSTLLPVPSEIHIQGGATEATFQTTTGIVGVETTITLSASKGSTTKSATVTILPFAMKESPANLKMKPSSRPKPKLR